MSRLQATGQGERRDGEAREFWDLRVEAAVMEVEYVQSKILLANRKSQYTCILQV